MPVITTTRVKHDGTLYLKGEAVPFKHAQTLKDAGLAEGELDDQGSFDIAAIAQAILSLDPANEANFTRENEPKLEVLSEVVGFKVSGEMREMAVRLIDGAAE